MRKGAAIGLYLSIQRGNKLTITDVDQRLANLGQAIDSTREANQAFFMRMERSIFLACLAGTLLVIWLLAGQIALCLVGWRGLGKTTTAVA